MQISPAYLPSALADIQNRLQALPVVIFADLFPFLR
jgi:hypothetical protein